MSSPAGVPRRTACTFADLSGVRSASCSCVLSNQLEQGYKRLLPGEADEVMSDQLSDSEVEDGYTTANVHTRSSRSAEDSGRASGMLHTEAVRCAELALQGPAARLPDR